MAIELATAYVSIVPDTKKLESGIKKAVDDGARHGTAAGAKLGDNMSDAMAAHLQTARAQGKIENSLRYIGKHGDPAGKQFAENMLNAMHRDLRSGSERIGAGIGLAMGKTISSQIRLDQRVMQGIGHAAGLALKAGMVGAVAGVGTILFKGFERLESLDKSRKQLERLGRGADEVKTIMADVNKVVEGTPIALNDALGEVPRLLAAGIKSGEQMTGVLTAMADAAGFSGDPFTGIAQGFDKVINTGKLTAEEIQNQFRNLPLVPWLAKSMGTDTASVTKMISDGKIGISQLVTAVEQGAGGMAKAAGDTIEGAMQNTMTAVARLGANLIAAAFGGDAVTASDNIVEGIKNIAAKFDELSGWVVAHKDEIHQFFTTMADAAKQVADALGKVLEFLADHPSALKLAGAAFVAWEAISVTATLATSLSAITTALGAIKTGAEGAGVALGGMNAAAEGGGLLALAGTLGTMAAAVAAIAGGAIAFEQVIPKTMTPEEKQRQAGRRGMLPDLLPGQEYRSPSPLGGGPGAERERRGVSPLDPTGGLLGGTIGAGTAGLAAPPNPSDVAANAGINRAADLSGGPYIPGVSDCSGYVSQVYSAMTGKPTHFTTTADFAALGFRPGYMPGALNIGVNPLPGMQGHMAATLPNGVNIESGGTSGGMLYGSQTGAQSKQFSQQWYFMPGGTFDDGGWLPPGYQWVINNTGKPELVLNEDQVKNMADQGVDPNTLIHGTGKGAEPGPPKLSPDQQQAFQAGMGALGMMQGQGQAEGPVNDPTKRTVGYIPAAVQAGANTVAGTSSLAGILDLGNQVVHGLIDTGAEAAKAAISMGAAAGGAAAFGGGAAAGPAAGAAAGFGIDMAANIGKRVSTYGFQLLSIAADSAIENMFPFGAPRWIGYDYTAFRPSINMQPIAAAVTTGEKAALAQQQQGAPPMPPGNQHMPPGATPGVPLPPGGPVSPRTLPGAQDVRGKPQGTQPAVQGFTPGLEPGTPTVTAPTPPQTEPSPDSAASQFQDPNYWMSLFGFDEGGWLNPGMTGVNTSRRPEPVFTDAQWQTLQSQLEPGSSGRNFGVTIQNLYAADANDVKRQIDAQQKLAMMRYAGRP